MYVFFQIVYYFYSNVWFTFCPSPQLRVLKIWGMMSHPPFLQHGETLSHTVKDIFLITNSTLLIIIKRSLLKYWQPVWFVLLIKMLFLSQLSIRQVFYLTWIKNKRKYTLKMWAGPFETACHGTWHIKIKLFWWHIAWQDSKMQQN